MVELSPYHPKVNGLSQASTNATERGKMGIKCDIYGNSTDMMFYKTGGAVFAALHSLRKLPLG